MSYLIIDVEQRTPEWFSARCGRLTASSAGDALLPPNRDGSEKAGTRNLRIKLALERITGKVAEPGFTTKAMQQGIEREPEARAIYEALTGHMVQQVGFVVGVRMVGASPDGVVLDGDGHIVHGVEFKCPEHAAHLEYLTTGNIGADYEAQVLFSLWLTGADSWDWMSYQPDFPEKLQTKLIAFRRDDYAEQIESMGKRWTAFLQSVDELEAQVRRLEAA